MNFGTTLEQEFENGNTESFSNENNNEPTPPKGKKFRNWFFTLNNYNPEDISMWTNKNLCPAEKFIMPEEIGSKTGTRHLQGYFELKNPRGLSGIKKELGPRYHLEVCRNREASIKYCQKLETRNGQQWSKGYRKPPRVLEKLRPWQAEVVKIVESAPDDRSIYWFWDAKGGSGKTALARYLCVNFDAMYVGGKASDIKYAVAQWLTTHDDIRAVIYDVSRTQESYLSYQSIEEIKNGIFFSGKYESDQVIYNPPHVIIFANFEPNLDALSLDRWKVRCLDEAVSLDVRVPHASLDLVVDA